MRGYSLAFDSRELPSKWVPFQIFLYFMAPSTVLIAQSIYLAYIVLSLGWKRDGRRSTGSRVFDPSPDWPPFIAPGWIFLPSMVIVVVGLLMLFVGPKDGPLNAHPYLIPFIWGASALALVHYSVIFDYAEGWPTYVVYFAAVMGACSVVGFAAAVVRSVRERAERRREQAVEA